MENKKLYRQGKAERIQNHKISFITNTERTSLGGKGKVPARNQKI